MRHPQHPTPDHERQADRLQDLAAALAALRKAVAGGDRPAVENGCRTLVRRLAAAALPGDDETEIRATIGLLEAQVRFGIQARLRRFLLPLVSALERQVEEAEMDL
jgi:hypothetical protein